MRKNIDLEQWAKENADRALRLASYIGGCSHWHRFPELSPKARVLFTESEKDAIRKTNERLKRLVEEDCTAGRS